MNLCKASMFNDNFGCHLLELFNCVSRWTWHMSLAKSTKSWLLGHGVTLPYWPTNRPHVNFTDNHWSVFKTKMSETRPNNENYLNTASNQAVPPFTFYRTTGLSPCHTALMQLFMQKKTFHNPDVLFKIPFLLSLYSFLT